MSAEMGGVLQDQPKLHLAAIDFGGLATGPERGLAR
jgi:hypothetical protein